MLAFLCTRDLSKLTATLPKWTRNLTGSLHRCRLRWKGSKKPNGMEISAEAVHGCRRKYHRLASVSDEAEEALNEGLGCAQRPRQRGAGDRGENETKYL